MIKIIIAVLTIIELGAGTIQGAASYTEFCNQLYYTYYTYHFVYCDFYDDDREHSSDVDFCCCYCNRNWRFLLGKHM